jgi:hypothetical protein
MNKYFKILLLLFLGTQWYTVGSLTASSIDLAIQKFGKTISSEKTFDELCDELEVAAGKKGVNNADDLLSGGKFVDDILEQDYQKYLARKAKEGKSPRERLEWKEVRDYWLYDSPIARGNAFNKKAEFKYDINELNLKVDGKNVRVDSYVPPKNGIEGQIISRKATDLDVIELSTFESYLKEMKKKYFDGALIRSDKYPYLDGQKLSGKQFLELPDTNKSLSNINEYINIAKKSSKLFIYSLQC